MRFSYHVHSTFSDGENTCEEIIETAEKLKLDRIGFSDHLILSNHIPDVHCLTEKDLPSYIQTLKSLKSSISIHKGLEVDFFPFENKTYKAVLESSPLDYTIGSVHFVGDQAISFRFSLENQDEINNLFKNYYILVRQMAESHLFDIVGHIDYIKKFNLKPTIDLSLLITEALKAIKEADMTIELNTSGWFDFCQEPYPSETILKQCYDLGIPCIITADAHKKENLVRNFEKGISLLKKIGYMTQVYYENRKKHETPL
jgi:histidinol-phosphatase (PHP family)